MTPLVLVPGMMCDARLFAPQIAALSGVLPIFLAPIAARARVEDLAADILVRAPPVFSLAGLSMGGIVAMEIVRQAPSRVERLALLDTNPLAEAEAVKERRGPQIEAVRQGRLESVMRDEMKPNYLADGEGRGAILDLCMDMALGLGPEVFIRQSCALMGRPDQTATLRECALPALILCGRHDTLCPIERHELMAGLILGSRLTVIERAGHLPTLEQSDAVNAEFRRWLDV
ncbi:MAG: alpha/beta hydrolase [Pseudomonadota bacterium]